MTRPHTLSATPSELIGANPRGALATVSLAVKGWWDAHRVGVDDALLVACSGGADSLALSLAVADLASRRAVPCYGLSVNHGLRPEARDEAAWVASTLRAWSVRSTVHHYPACVWQDAQVGEGPEAYARTLRYEAFERATTELVGRHAGRIFLLLGHTADDQAETVLLRLSRGSGVGSLRAMPAMRPLDPQRRRILARPLLGVRRADTAAACRQAGLSPVEDPTNAPNGPWRTHTGQPLPRIAIRHEVMPVLTRALGVDPVGALVRTAQQAACDDDALNEYAQRAFAEAATCAGRVVVDIEAAARHPLAVRMRMWHHACLEAGARPSALNSTHVAGVEALVSDWHGQGPLSLPGIQVVRKATQLTFTRG